MSISCRSTRPVAESCPSEDGWGLVWLNSWSRWLGPLGLCECIADRGMRLRIASRGRFVDRTLTGLGQAGYARGWRFRPCECGAGLAAPEPRGEARDRGIDPVWSLRTRRGYGVIVVMGPACITLAVNTAARHSARPAARQFRAEGSVLAAGVRARQNGMPRRG